MIITCEECSTSFNLDEKLIKPSGSKVRCSKCKHVFVAFPEAAPEKEAPPEETPAPEKEAFQADDVEGDAAASGLSGAAAHMAEPEAPVADEETSGDLDLDIDAEPEAGEEKEPEE